MTDQEKKTLSERIATLAEAAGLAMTLAWEPADHCAQGHWWSDQEYYLKTYTVLVDGNRFLCPVCVFEEFADDGKNLSAYADAYCLPKIPKYLTNPENLLPLVKAWIARQPEDEGWSYLITWWKEHAYSNIYEFDDRGSCRSYKGEDPESEWITLAQAFAGALEKGVD